MRKKIIVLILVTFLLFSLGTTTFAAEFVSQPYLDYDNNLPAFILTSLGIMQGDGGIGGYFRPDNSITREEFVAVALRLYELEHNREYTNLFKSRGSDKPSSVYNVESNILIDSFADGADVSLWARNYMGTAIEIGLIKGYADNTLRPKQNVTQAEVVTVLMRVLGNQEIAENRNISWPENYDTLPTSPRIPEYTRNSPATRGQVASLVLASFQSLTNGLSEPGLVTEYVATVRILAIDDTTITVLVREDGTHDVMGLRLPEAYLPSYLDMFNNGESYKYFVAKYNLADTVLINTESHHAVGHVAYIVGRGNTIHGIRVQGQDRTMTSSTIPEAEARRTAHTHAQTVVDSYVNENDTLPTSSGTPSFVARDKLDLTLAFNYLYVVDSNGIVYTEQTKPSSTLLSLINAAKLDTDTKYQQVIQKAIDEYMKSHDEYPITEENIIDYDILIKTGYLLTAPIMSTVLTDEGLVQIAD